MNQLAAEYKPHLIRYGILVLYILLVVHFLNYSKIPFSVGYAFPWVKFLAMTLFSIPICTVNWLIFKKIKPRNIEGFIPRVLAQAGINTLFTLVLYTFLYWLMNIVIFDAEFHVFLFLKYLLVCLTLVITEVGFLTAYEMYQKKGNELVIPIKATNDSFVFESGKKHIQVAWNEVIFFHSSGGIVSVYLANQRYTTHFSSLNEIVEEMPPDRFFRISRQFLISRECIREIRKEVNRKLSVWIHACEDNEGMSPIIISRYRSQEFLRWFEGEIK